MAGEYDLNFREHPEAFRFQHGEQGVFKVEPYKSEILPNWQYKDESAAEESSAAIWEQFIDYRAAEDFVGMDMARKYLQMGFTRAMRYAKYPGGRKYDDDGHENEPQTWADEEKREAAVVFKSTLDAAKDDDTYQRLRERHKREVYDPDASPM
ncbi:MAG: DUF4385 domain-containing protein [Bacteroidetes bacterium QS_8_68_28]|jgi:hypothetical protein|nr:MAG: DUF4385 domain-containing protein [Bacteroidetes bacterium QS_8_68_28]